VDLAERFDHVLVMDQGKLVEQGTYDELVNRDSAMRRLLKTG
jgi:ABC-type multidrug transport system fused ATPase/permease subunit